MVVKYARVEKGVITKYVTERAALDPDSIRIVGGEPMLRPIVDDARPAFDPETQEITHVEIIEPTQVRNTWAVKDRDLTAIKASSTRQINRLTREKLVDALPDMTKVAAVRRASDTALAAVSSAIDGVQVVNAKDISWPA